MVLVLLQLLMKVQGHVYISSLCHSPYHCWIFTNYRYAEDNEPSVNCCRCYKLHQKVFFWLLPALISNCFCYYERQYHNFVIGLSLYLSFYVSKSFFFFQSTANCLNCTFSTDFTFFWFYTWVSVFNINKTFTVSMAIKFCLIKLLQSSSP